MTLFLACLFVGFITAMIQAKDYPLWVNIGMGLFAASFTYVTFSSLPLLF